MDLMVLTSIGGDLIQIKNFMMIKEWHENINSLYSSL